jgi:hypothetical protein
MISFTVTSTGEEQVERALLDLQYRMLDLHPLGRRIADLVEVDNMAARMMGVDKDDQPFAPLSPATWEWNPNRGPGPPLAPMESSSRIVSDLTMELVDLGPGALDIIGSWPNMPFLIHHVTGTSRMPSRDPVGIRPRGWATILEVSDEWVEALLTNRY